MNPPPKLPLLELDPELGALIPGDERSDAAHDLRVEVVPVARGPWDAGPGESSAAHVGLLLVDGVIAREVLVSDVVSTELLGPGDLIRPWPSEGAPTMLQHSVRWNVLTESRLAILDARLGARLARWPQINAVLIDRVNERAMRLATTQAISQINRVDRRLLSLFWHLAERWGRMTADGVAIPLTLSHRMLGQLIGASRPTITTTVGELNDRDELARRSDGTWLLRGDRLGLPTVRAAQVIPIRRKLLAQAPKNRDHPERTEPAPKRMPAPTKILPQRERSLAPALDETRLQTEKLMTESRRLYAEAIASRDKRTRGRPPSLVQGAAEIASTSSPT